MQLHVNQWISKITDVTELAVEMGALVKSRQRNEALRLLPAEAPYPADVENVLPIPTGSISA